MKLRIKQTSWSGWTKDYKPEEKEEDYDIILNEKYVIKSSEVSYFKENELVEEVRELFSFVITEINENSIKIKTFQSFSDGPGGINLLTDKKEFTVYDEQPLKLTTPTMDSGLIFILSLVK